MRIERIYTNTNILSFKESTRAKNTNTENAILMLRDPKAGVKFQKSQELARKADSADTNPIVALGYKLYRTFSIIKNTENESSKAENKQLNTVA
jgi:hypothetical protein